MDRYGRLSHTIAKSRELSSQAKVVYVVLDMCRNPKTGKCNPKQETIADFSGMSRKVVNRSIRELKKLGLLVIAGSKRYPFYRLQTDLFAGSISPTDGTNEQCEQTPISPTRGTSEGASISPTRGTSGQREQTPISPTRGTSGGASISPTHGTNGSVDNLVDNVEKEVSLVPPVGQASRKAKGKEKKKTPLTPRRKKTALLVLKFSNQPDPCMLQRLHSQFTFDGKEWTAKDTSAPREIWEDTQEQYEGEVKAMICTAEVL